MTWAATRAALLSRHTSLAELYTLLAEIRRHRDTRSYYLPPMGTIARGLLYLDRRPR